MTYLAGVKVYLLNANGVKIDSTATGTDGKYLFSNLPLGTYSVQFVAPAGKTFVTPLIGGDITKDSDAGVTGKTAPITLTAATPNVTSTDAGLKPSIGSKGSIGDYVFLDNDGSNTQTAGDSPVKNVKVYLLDSLGKKIDSTFTGSDGKYLFGNLPLGTYSIQFVTPVGLTFVTPAQGGDITKDSDAGVTGKSAPITLTAATPNVLTVDAGIKPSTDIIDLHLVKKVDAKSVKLGDVVTYTIKVWNESSKNATGVEVTDQLPAGLQYVSNTASRGIYNSTTGLWTIENIAAAGDTVTLNLKAKVVSEGVTFNTAEVTRADQKDKDSTPGNGVDGEDDLDRVCISAPVKLCLGQGAQATVPANYTGIIWKDAAGVVVPSSGNTVTFTKAGTYTFTATNGQCPTGGCCPVIVEEINCCPAELCIPFTITKKKR